MFDYVKYEANCFLCGTSNTGWQTKSAKDEESLLRQLEVSDVKDDFYEICKGCGAWIEYDVSEGTPRLKEQSELHDSERVDDGERQKAEEIKRMSAKRPKLQSN